MTDHPLTDEVCREVADSMIDFPNGFPDAHDHMRAGADWQLEQVIEWIEANPIEDYVYTDYSGAIVKEQEFLKNLKQAMRPQENN